MEVFELIDKTGKTIILTKERWAHIRQSHPQVELEEIKITLRLPIKIIKINNIKYFYFKYFKNKNLPNKFMKVIIKYKSNKWLIMTSYFVSRIR